jgi:hypothetical protein
MAKTPKLTAEELDEAVKLYTASKLKEADEDGDKKNVDFVKNLKKGDDKDDEDDSDDEDDEDDEDDSDDKKLKEAIIEAVLSSIDEADKNDANLVRKLVNNKWSEKPRSREEAGKMIDKVKSDVEKKKKKMKEAAEMGEDDTATGDEAGEGGGAGSGESPFEVITPSNPKGHLTQGVSEATKKRVLTQSYREDEQPAVADMGSPFGGDEGKLKQGVSEATTKIFEGETLSEDFKKKAATVIEAIVTSQVVEETKRIEAIAQKNLKEAKKAIKQELTEQADRYVAYVVNEWLEENAMVAEPSLKLDIYEAFFEGLRNLFNEHNITIPSENIDLLEAKSAEVKKLTKQINALTEKLLGADKIVLESKKGDVLKKLSEGLAATQVEKLKQLTNDIDAKTLESFTEKATIIKESFFKESAKAPAKKDDATKIINENAVDPEIAKLLERMKNI